MLVNAEHRLAKNVFSQALFHRQQFVLSPTDDIADHVNSDLVLMHPVLNAAAQKLSSMGYPSENLASEAAAFLAADVGKVLLGIERGEALSGLTHYFDHVFEVHGDKAMKLLNETMSPYKEELLQRYAKRPDNH